MNRRIFGWLLLCGVAGFTFFHPAFALAYDFETRTQGLTKGLVSTVLPLLSTLGLVYAAFLAVTGDAGARGRISAIIFSSAIGFLAPAIIEWLKAAAGGP